MRDAIESLQQPPFFLLLPYPHFQFLQANESRRCLSSVTGLFHFK
ncbi:mCG148342 [Mus musculus]|nr:mCG148342 [Mus musculus]